MRATWTKRTVPKSKFIQFPECVEVKEEVNADADEGDGDDDKEGDVDEKDGVGVEIHPVPNLCKNQGGGRR